MIKQIAVVSLLLGVSLVGLAEDHSEFFEDDFGSPQEVTTYCLECHGEAGEAFLHSDHWNWTGMPEMIEGHDQRLSIGKKNVLNNFCIGLEANWPRCTSCHAGYGWQDASFDFSNPENIDCLICHDGSGTYRKNPKGAGMPTDDVDLLTVARSVTLTSRETCGACHFYGGGGNNVKHGDLENALVDPPESLDVHMGGMDFSCTECHLTDDHNISGNSLSISTHSETLACENCHSDAPHEARFAKYLNRHVKTVACQTCHIPEFARANPTKMEWDWSQAGQDRDPGKDQYGKKDYDKKKGAFVWGKDVVPEYAWYNGNSQHMILGDELVMDSVNQITAPIGDIEDPDARIYPFKIHRGKQIADRQNHYLLPVHLFGKGGYWATFDWQQSATNGAAAAGIEYSGGYTFVETEMYWKINHMVAPQDEALSCRDCHIRNGQARLDWELLGYDGDPMFEKLSRFSQ